jgi:hypothetical protein
VKHGLIIHELAETALLYIQDLDEEQASRRCADHPAVLTCRTNVRRALNGIINRLPTAVPHREVDACREICTLCEGGLKLLMQYERRLVPSDQLQELHVNLQLSRALSME